MSFQSTSLRRGFVALVPPVGLFTSVHQHVALHATFVRERLVARFTDVGLLSSAVDLGNTLHVQLPCPVGFSLSECRRGVCVGVFGRPRPWAVGLSIDGLRAALPDGFYQGPPTPLVISGPSPRLTDWAHRVTSLCHHCTSYCRTMHTCGASLNCGSACVPSDSPSGRRPHHTTHICGAFPCCGLPYVTSGQLTQRRPCCTYHKSGASHRCVSSDSRLGRRPYHPAHTCGASRMCVFRWLARATGLSRTSHQWASSVSGVSHRIHVACSRHAADMWLSSVCSCMCIFRITAWVNDLLHM